MKAVVYDRYGGPELLRLVEVDRPAPGPDEVLVVRPNLTDLLAGTELALQGGPLAPVVDRMYPLDEVAEALRRRGEGHARGKVVVTPG